MHSRKSCHKWKTNVSSISRHQHGKTSGCHSLWLDLKTHPRNWMLTLWRQTHLAWENPSICRWDSSAKSTKSTKTILGFSIAIHICRTPHVDLVDPRIDELMRSWTVPGVMLGLVHGSDGCQQIWGWIHKKTQKNMEMICADIQLSSIIN